VVLGRIAAPFGIAGWFRIQAYTASVDNLLAYQVWWVGKGAQWQQYELEKARAQGAALIAKLKGCDDRNSAARLRGSEIAVARNELPHTTANEWYWTDLIGLKAANLAGEEFGEVVRILQTGSNDVLVVQGERERLIPFIEEVVREVDLAAGIIRLDWRAEY
jgi:16S rRNA processing protein RimM